MTGARLRVLVREREEYFRLMDQGLTSDEACQIVGMLQGLRYILRPLKRRRVIFTDPTTRIFCGMPTATIPCRSRSPTSAWFSMTRRLRGRPCQRWSSFALTSGTSQRADHGPVPRYGSRAAPGRTCLPGRPPRPLATARRCAGDAGPAIPQMAADLGKQPGAPSLFVTRE
jgi:hypothetical protein